MTVPKFGDIAANAHFGFESGFFNFSPGDQTITANNSYTATVATLTVPMNSSLVVEANCYFYINGTAFQYAIATMDLSLNPADPAPGTNDEPESIYNYASATNPYPIMTLPTFGHWETCVSGRTAYVKVKLAAGTGTPDVIFRTCSGTYKWFRT